MFVALLIINL